MGSSRIDRRTRLAASAIFGLLLLASAPPLGRVFAQRDSAATTTSESPASPRGVRPRDGARLFTRHVVFDWTRHPQAARYQLQIAEVVRANEDPFAAVLAADLTVEAPPQVVMAGLDWGRRYAWRVRPLRIEEGEPRPIAGWSAAQRFEVAPLPPHCPPIGTQLYRPREMHPGLTLFNVSSPNRIFGGRDAGIALAIDAAGQIVWFRYEPKRFTDLRLLPNGRVLFVTDNAAVEAELDGTVTWRTPERIQVHHDATPLPNGNVLCLVYDTRSVTIGGRREEWQGDAVVEVTRSGRVVWRWSAWDHLPTSVRDAPTYEAWNRREPFDWTHGNAAYYSAAERAVYVSLRNVSRVVKVDRRTRRVVWQMGAGCPLGDGLFTYQHAPQIIAPGRMLLFDNGNRRRGRTPGPPEEAFSRAIELAYDEKSTPPTVRLVWEYRVPYGQAQGEADRLPNGNTLIADGYNGRIVEVSPEGEPVWEMTLPGAKPQDYIIYRSERIPSLYPQLGNPPVVR